MIKEKLKPIARRAGKIYQCELCHTEIKKGEKHTNSPYLVGEKVRTFRTHSKCAKIAEKINEIGQNSNRVVSVSEFNEFIEVEYYKLFKKHTLRFKTKLNAVYKFYYKKEPKKHNNVRPEINLIAEVVSRLKYKFKSEGGQANEVSGNGLSANAIYKAIDGKDIQISTLLLILNRLGFSFADFCRLYLTLIKVK